MAEEQVGVKFVTTADLGGANAATGAIKGVTDATKQGTTATSSATPETAKLTAATAEMGKEAEATGIKKSVLVKSLKELSHHIPGLHLAIVALKSPYILLAAAIGFAVSALRDFIKEVDEMADKFSAFDGLTAKALNFKRLAVEVAASKAAFKATLDEIAAGGNSSAEVMGRLNEKLENQLRLKAELTGSKFERERAELGKKFATGEITASQHAAEEAKIAKREADAENAQRIEAARLKVKMASWTVDQASYNKAKAEAALPAAEKAEQQAKNELTVATSDEKATTNLFGPQLEAARLKRFNAALAVGDVQGERYSLADKALLAAGSTRLGVAGAKKGLLGLREKEFAEAAEEEKRLENVIASAETVRSQKEAKAKSAEAVAGGFRNTITGESKTIADAKIKLGTAGENLAAESEQVAKLRVEQEAKLKAEAEKAASNAREQDKATEENRLKKTTEELKRANPGLNIRPENLAPSGGGAAFAPGARDFSTGAVQGAITDTGDEMAAALQGIGNAVAGMGGSFIATAAHLQQQFNDLERRVRDGRA